MSPGDRPERPVPIARPSFDEGEERLLLETLRSGWVTQGPRVAEFEERFAAAVEAECAVAVSSCTAGLFLSLKALGIGPGDEVIVPSLTHISSVNVITHTGATPVLVDVDPRTYNVGVDDVAAGISDRTRAVLVVHQLGQPADLDPIQRLADTSGFAVVEDAACAVGASYRGRPIGSSGNLVAFSFHPRKVLVTGEGGMIATGDAELAARLRRLRHQGMAVSDLERHRASRVITETYPEVGYNFRLSDLHAAVGLAQLSKLAAFVSARRALAARYDERLADLPAVELRACPDFAEPNQQSYIVRIRAADRAVRDALLDTLLARGVVTRRGLMAVHREAPYRDARTGGSLVHSEQADSQTLILPLFADLAPADLDYVVRQLREALAAVPGL